ncbi:hypothetical protein B0H16DRAFT_1462010 [Mycena metata]|uniref:Uncharacterized protein n=1 Tax=Mycena metata TaxID=1033252 RepID=A0AAD7IRX9_9AGAR|nr:hypothetical protein B0H16DRAFT_1462010 [Mycena metata]
MRGQILKFYLPNQAEGSFKFEDEYSTTQYLLELEALRRGDDMINAINRPTKKMFSSPQCYGGVPGRTVIQKYKKLHVKRIMAGSRVERVNQVYSWRKTHDIALVPSMRYPAFPVPFVQCKGKFNQFELPQLKRSPNEKTNGTEQGLFCVDRQWRAPESNGDCDTPPYTSIHFPNQVPRDQLQRREWGARYARGPRIADPLAQSLSRTTADVQYIGVGCYAVKESAHVKAVFAMIMTQPSFNRNNVVHHSILIMTPKKPAPGWSTSYHVHTRLDSTFIVVPENPREFNMVVTLKPRSHPA